MNKSQLLIAAILFLVIGINAKTNPLGVENANSIAENDTILAAVDKEPEFPGGNAARTHTRPATNAGTGTAPRPPPAWC